MLRRRGFTLIELLVVVAILGALIALLLPAVQAAREASRRTLCHNNVRQVVLASHSFHTATGALPSFYNGTELTYPLAEFALFNLHSWRVLLLPYVEQSPLREQVRWDAMATAAENAPVGQTVVPTFICPNGEDPSNMGWGIKYGAVVDPAYSIPESARYYLVRSDYDAMAGVQVLPEPLPTNSSLDSVDFVRWGIWGRPEFEMKTTSGSHLLRYVPGKFRDVTDGLSSTIAIVERGGRPYEMRNGKRDIAPYNPDGMYVGQCGWSASNTISWTLHRDGVGVNESNSSGIYSLHPGGATVGMGDGSVRFFSDTTDFKTLAKLYGRSDGEVVDK